MKRRDQRPANRKVTPPQRMRKPFFTKKNMIIAGTGAGAITCGLKLLNTYQRVNKVREKNGIKLSAAKGRLTIKCRANSDKIMGPLLHNGKKVKEIKKMTEEKIEEGKSYTQVREEILEYVKNDDVELAKMLGEGAFQEIWDHALEHLETKEEITRIFEQGAVQKTYFVREVDDAKLTGLLVGGGSTVLLLAALAAVAGRKTWTNWILSKIRPELEKEVEPSEPREEPKKELPKYEVTGETGFSGWGATKHAMERANGKSGVTTHVPKKKKTQKSRLKRRLFRVLEPVIGADAGEASRVLWRTFEEEICREIVQEPTRVTEIVEENMDPNSQDSGLWRIVGILHSKANEIDGGVEEESRDTPTSTFRPHEMIHFSEEIEAVIRAAGLDVESVKKAIVEGFRLHAEKKAYGSAYLPANVIEKNIRRAIKHNKDCGRETNEIIDFLYSHGIISTYKQGDTMMINAVPGLGQSQEITEFGSLVLKSIDQFLFDFQQMQTPNGN